MARWDRVGEWCGVVILVAYAVFTASHLNRSLWYDEIFTFNLSRFGWIFNLTHYPVPNHHLIHTLLVGLVPSDAEAWLIRLPAWCAGVLSIGASWYFLKCLGCSVAARLISLIFLVTSPYVFAYTVQARGYSLQWLGLVLLLLTLSDHKGLLGRFHEKGSLYVWCVGLVCLCYSVPTGLLMLPPFLVTSVMMSRARRTKSDDERTLTFSDMGPACLGGMMLLVLFVPLANDIVRNASMGQGGGDPWSLLSMWSTSFGSGRWGQGFLLLMILIVVLNLRNSYKWLAMVVLAMILIVMGVFWFRDQQPFLRNFLPLTFMCFVLLGPGLEVLFRRRFHLRLVALGLVFLSAAGHSGLLLDVLERPNFLLYQDRNVEQWDVLFEQLDNLQRESEVVISQVPKAHAHLLGVGHYLWKSALVDPAGEDRQRQLNNVFEQGGSLVLHEARLLNGWSQPPQRESREWSENLHASFTGVESPIAYNEIEHANVVRHQVNIPSTFVELPARVLNQRISPQEVVSKVDPIGMKSYRISGSNQNVSVVLRNQNWHTPGSGTAVLAYDVSAPAQTDISLMPNHGTYKRDPLGPFIRRSVMSEFGGPANLVQMCWLVRKKGGAITFVQPSLVQPLSANKWRVFTWVSVSSGESLMPCIRYSLGYKEVAFTLDIRWHRMYYR